MKAFLCLLLLVLVAPAFASEQPSASKFDSRIQSVDYNPENVVVINAYPGTATQIVFAPGESVLDIASGFSDGWEVNDRRNNLYLKPKSLKGGEGVNRKPEPGEWDTNLIVTTDQRVYSFQLVLLKGREDKGVGSDARAAYRIAFRYPADELEKAAKKVADAALKEKLDQKPAPKNWAYSMQPGKASQGIAPTMAYDDGRFTYLRFPNNREWPAVFVVAEDKTESLVNSHIDPAQPDVLVVHRVAQRLSLRLGKAVVGVFNEAFDADGVPPKDGTTIEGLKRTIRTTNEGVAQ